MHSSARCKVSFLGVVPESLQTSPDLCKIFREHCSSDRWLVHNPDDIWGFSSNAPKISSASCRGWTQNLGWGLQDDVSWRFRSPVVLEPPNPKT